MYVAVAITIALSCAVSAAAAVAGWRQAVDRGPSIASALAVARAAGSGAPVEVLRGVGEDRPPPGLRVAPAYVLVSVPGPGPDAVRARLIAQGWRAGDVSTDHGMRSFWAERAGLIVRVSDWDGSVVAVWVFRGLPSWLAPAVATAALVGLAGGWLLAGWAMRAFRRHGGRTRAGALLLGVPGLFAAAIFVTYAGFVVAVEGIAGGWPARTAALVTSARDMVPLAGTALIALAGAAAVLSTPSRERVAPGRAGPGTTWRALAGTAAAAHLAFAMVACGVLVAYAAGRPTDPKDLVPFGTGQYNPLMWAFDLVVMLYLTGILISPALLAVSVPLLVSGRVLRLPRIGRMWTVLLLAAATSVVPVLLVLSPLGRAAGGVAHGLMCARASSTTASNGVVAP